MTDRQYTFSYVDCDVPEDVTLADWRRRRVRAERPHRLGLHLRTGRGRRQLPAAPGRTSPRS